MPATLTNPSVLLTRPVFLLESAREIISYQKGHVPAAVQGHHCLDHRWKSRIRHGCFPLINKINKFYWSYFIFTADLFLALDIQHCINFVIKMKYHLYLIYQLVYLLNNQSLQINITLDSKKDSHHLPLLDPQHSSIFPLYLEHKHHSLYQHLPRPTSITTLPYSLFFPFSSYPQRCIVISPFLPSTGNRQYFHHKESDETTIDLRDGNIMHSKASEHRNPAIFFSNNFIFQHLKFPLLGFIILKLWKNLWKNNLKEIIYFLADATSKEPTW